MTDHNPYTYETIGRASVGGDHYVQAEDWVDERGERTFVALVAASYSGDESVTMIVSSAEEARRLKKLFAQVERRMT